MPCRPRLAPSSSFAISVSFRKSLRRSWASVVAPEQLLTFRRFGSAFEFIGTPRISGVVLVPLLTEYAFCKKWGQPLVVLITESSPGERSRGIGPARTLDTDPGRSCTGRGQEPSQSAELRRVAAVLPRARPVPVGRLGDRSADGGGGRPAN